MNERVKFIARYLEDEEAFAMLCKAAGISRKPGYKWVAVHTGHMGNRSARVHG